MCRNHGEGRTTTTHLHDDALPLAMSCDSPMRTALRTFPAFQPSYASNDPTNGMGSPSAIGYTRLRCVGVGARSSKCECGCRVSGHVSLRADGRAHIQELAREQQMIIMRACRYVERAKEDAGDLLVKRALVIVLSACHGCCPSCWWCRILHRF
jgi:hypothetical protein